MLRPPCYGSFQNHVLRTAVSYAVEGCRSQLSIFAVSCAEQWRRYTRARKVKRPGWKIHRPGFALPSPAYCFALIIHCIVWTENKNVTSDRFICFIVTVKRRWWPVFWGRQLETGRQLFLRKKVHSGDLAGGFSDLLMTWLLCCAGATTDAETTKARGQGASLPPLF